MNVTCDIQHYIFRYLLNARRDIHMKLSDLRFRTSRLFTKKSVEPVIGHCQSSRIIKIGLIKPERSVFLYVDQIVENLIDESRFPIWRKPHQLILGRINLEAGIIGKRTVQKAQGM